MKYPAKCFAKGTLQCFSNDLLEHELSRIGPLGTMWFSNGSSLFELCTEGVFGAFSEITTWMARLNAQLRVAFSEWCSFMRSIGKYQTHSRFTCNVLSLKHLSSIPALKSKARAALYVNQWLLSVTQRDTSSDHKQSRAAVHWGYLSMHEIFAQTKIRLDDHDIALLKLAGDAFFHNSRNLQFESLCTGGMRLWHLVPKHHALIHLVQDALRCHMNPRTYWTWADEDFVRITSNLSKALHGGTAQTQAVEMHLDELRAEFSKFGDR